MNLPTLFLILAGSILMLKGLAIAIQTFFGIPETYAMIGLVLASFATLGGIHIYDSVKYGDYEE